MATYTISRVITESVQVSAENESKAIAAACRLPAEWPQVKGGFKAERHHEEFEYQVRIEDDQYPDIEGMWEDEEDKAAAYLYGVVGFVAERRALDTEDGEPGEWEHVDSCWGFIACDGFRDCIREHLSDEFKQCEF
jgi:hypothetical protein